MPKPPIDPDSFDKVNFVIDAWTTGCDAPWYIYVETMKPALLTAFITLITFGWDDVIRGYFRPKGLYKRRTAKRKGRWTRRLPRFPEIGNTLGKQLPMAQPLTGKQWGTLGKTLWRIDGVMEQVRFFWLVASIVEDFVFDWTSLLYESYWCQDDPPGRFSYQRIGWFVINADSWKLVGFGTEDYHEGMPHWFHLSGVTGDNPAQITAALDIMKAPAFPAPTEFSVRIYNDDTGEVYAETGPAELNSDGEGSVPVFGIVPANTSFAVRARMSGTPWALFGQGVVIGTEILP
ncbi:MAG TPA: hypothetical protein ENH80_09190 [Phycisphaerae bacterium]|nr:hypothetical protein [Phycisphaerae bacterium]